MDLHLHPSSLAAVKTQVGGLRDDNQVRPDLVLLDDILPAEPITVLLHHAAGEVDGNILIKPKLLQYATGGDKRSRSAFLIH